MRQKHQKDKLTKEARSLLMGKVRSKNTNPELRIRTLLHANGYRFRLHRRDLPGSPDIVFPSRKKVIFVHGCFWHRHEGCKYCTTPGTRKKFWTDKFEANMARDLRNVRELKKIGWRSLVIWSCEVEKTRKVLSRIIKFLS
jgi:DNA mismatch endonuclease, patch repair protein